jgi:hypothetical protein
MPESAALNRQYNRQYRNLSPILQGTQCVPSPETLIFCYAYPEHRVILPLGGQLGGNGRSTPTAGPSEEIRTYLDLERGALFFWPC